MLISEYFDEFNRQLTAFQRTGLIVSAEVSFDP